MTREQRIEKPAIELDGTATAALGEGMYRSATAATALVEEVLYDAVEMLGEKHDRPRAARFGNGLFHHRVCHLRLTCGLCRFSVS